MGKHASLTMAAAAFAGFVIAIIVVADLGYGPQMFPVLYETRGLDGLGHLVLMGTLALLVNLSWRRHVIIGSLLVAAVVTAEEFSQLLVPTRNFSLIDLGCDYIGIACGGWLAVHKLFTAKKSA